MVFTLINMLGVILFAVIISVGCAVKHITGQHVKDLNGFAGTVKKSEEYKKGRIFFNIID